MTHSPKLELLGQISERARELEVVDDCRHCALWSAVLAVGARPLNDETWPQTEDALVDVAAAALNWLLSGMALVKDAEVAGS